MVKVRIVEGPGAGKEYEIEHAAILGRLDSNDIPVQDPKASREHAKIYKQGSQFSIVDLNSSNGTFVNGDQITKQALSHDDVISIGKVTIVFENPEEAALKAAAPKRKSLDDAFASGGEKESKAAASGAAPEIVLSGHKPLQYSRVQPGRPLLGFDMDQLSPLGKLIVWVGIALVVAVLAFMSYKLVSG
ncbi:MAG: FHA domain-containing protein [Planctomycetota bacterium]